MDYLPIFLRVQNRRALIVGGGAVAARKAELLLQSGAQVTLIAPGLADGTRELLDAHPARVTYLPAVFEPAQLRDATLVLAATDSPATNAAVAAAARERGIPVNVADDAELSDFILPAIVDRSPVIVAVGSEGTSPVLSRRLRERIEALLPAGLGRLARLAARRRPQVQAALPPERRRLFWERFFDQLGIDPVAVSDEAAADVVFEQLLEDFKANLGRPTGEVWLIGAGPGNPDLLTLRALQLLQQADVILYDRLVPAAVLARARREAERVFVGKQRGEAALPQERINALLVEYALKGLKVARLKGGDPFIFGRGGEEAAAAAAHGIPVTVVPGITAALGAAASAGIPLTRRQVSQSVTFVPGHVAVSDTLDWPALARSGHTVVFYMAMAQLDALTARLIAAGAPPTRGAALVAQATQPQQRVARGTLGDIAATARAAQFSSPALLIVGDVTRA